MLEGNPYGVRCSLCYWGVPGSCSRKEFSGNVSTRNVYKSFQWVQFGFKLWHPSAVKYWLLGLDRPSLLYSYMWHKPARRSFPFNSAHLTLNVFKSFQWLLLPFVGFIPSELRTPTFCFEILASWSTQSSICARRSFPFNSALSLSFQQQQKQRSSWEREGSSSSSS